MDILVEDIGERVNYNALALLIDDGVLLSEVAREAIGLTNKHCGLRKFRDARWLLVERCPSATNRPIALVRALTEGMVDAISSEALHGCLRFYSAGSNSFLRTPIKKYKELDVAEPDAGLPSEDWFEIDNKTD